MFAMAFMVFSWFPWYFKVFLALGWSPWLFRVFKVVLLFLVGFHGFSGFFWVSVTFWFVSMVFMVTSWWVHGRFVIFLGSCCTIMKYGEMMFYNLFFLQIPTRTAIAQDVFTKPIQILSMLSYPFVATVQRRSYVSIFRRR